LEHLNRRESNIVTTFEESSRITAQKDDPFFRSILDSYHFSLEKEPLSLIVERKKQIGHLHFARTEERCFPAQRDFPGLLPFLQAVKDSGYDNTFSMECAFPQMAEEPAEYGRVLALFRQFFSPHS